jgi:iron(III) transport system ATP-binding protein
LTAEAVIRLNNVTKSYDHITAVDDLSLTIGQRTFTVLLGESGCGKTTTLRLAAGLERPERGEIWVNDRLVAGENRWVAPEQRQIGMVFQDYALFPHLTVSDNIAFALNTMPKQQRQRRIDNLLALVGLEGRGGRYPHQLSGGQQQRVALARALAPSPAILLLDEPFSNLDAGLRKVMREEVLGILRQTGATTLFVTHDQEEAMRLADEIAILHQGKILQMGSPDQLYRQPLTPDIARFLGEVNFIPGAARGEVVETALGVLPLAYPVYGQAQVMIRPEAFTLLPDADANADVTDTRYFGHYRSIRVRHRSGLLLEAKVWAHNLFQIGDAVRLSVQGDVVAFRAQ